jgi:hypothetical protein
MGGNSPAMLGAADVTAKARARKRVFMGVLLAGIAAAFA